MAASFARVKGGRVDQGETLTDMTCDATYPPGGYPVAPKDLGQFPQIYREAHAAHERLYAGMNAVLREKQLA